MRIIYCSSSSTKHAQASSTFWSVKHVDPPACSKNAAAFPNAMDLDMVSLLLSSCSCSSGKTCLTLYDLYAIAASTKLAKAYGSTIALP